MVKKVITKKVIKKVIKKVTKKVTKKPVDVSKKKKVLTFSERIEKYIQINQKKQAELNRRFQESEKRFYEQRLQRQREYMQNFFFETFLITLSNFQKSTNLIGDLCYTEKRSYTFNFSEDSYKNFYNFEQYFDRILNLNNLGIKIYPLVYRKKIFEILELIFKAYIHNYSFVFVLATIYNLQLLKLLQKKNFILMFKYLDSSEINYVVYLNTPSTLSYVEHFNKIHDNKSKIEEINLEKSKIEEINLEKSKIEEINLEKSKISYIIKWYSFYNKPIFYTNHSINRIWRNEKSFFGLVITENGFMSLLDCRTLNIGGEIIILLIKL